MADGRMIRVDKNEDEQLITMYQNEFDKKVKPKKTDIIYSLDELKRKL